MTSLLYILSLAAGHAGRVRSTADVSLVHDDRPIDSGVQVIGLVSGLRAYMCVERIMLAQVNVYVEGRRLSIALLDEAYAHDGFHNKVVPQSRSVFPGVFSSRALPPRWQVATIDIVFPRS